MNAQQLVLQERTSLDGMEQQYRMLLQSITDPAIILLDAGGRIASWSVGAERLFGYPAEEVLGQSTDCLFLPEDVEQGIPHRELNAAAAQGTAEDVRWHPRKDGSRLWMNGTVTALRDERGSLRGFVKVARDLTSQKHLEDQFQERSKLLNLARVLMHQLDGTITYWSDGMRQLYGWTAEEAIGTISHTLFHTCFPLPLERIMDELFARGEWEGELTRKRKGGQRLTVIAHWLLKRDAAGTPVAVLEVNNDVTDRKQLEDRLQDLNRRKDVFFAVLGHELRNPLAPLQNGLELLKLRNGEDARSRGVREMMERQVHQLVRLVDDLLDVSRAATGKLQLHKHSVDLTSVLSRAVEASSALVESRRHRLDVSHCPEPIRVHVDPARLTQVFTNLLNNAAKYTPEGGHIWVATYQEGQEAVVRVRDNGIGMAPEMLPQVFELFSQAQPVAGRQPGGLGIGLTLVKRLVEMHEGRVEAHSAGLGQGSEFVVRLPCIPHVVEPEVPAQEGPAIAPPFQRVLVVEDNVDSAESLAMVLRLQGHKVHTVHDGKAALTAAEAFGPGVVILDIGLPDGMSGYELAPRLRELAGLGNVILIALTGYGREEDQRRSRAAGINYHLTKPVNFEDLNRLLAGPN